MGWVDLNFNQNSAEKLKNLHVQKEKKIKVAGGVTKNRVAVINNPAENAWLNFSMGTFKENEGIAYQVTTNLKPDTDIEQYWTILTFVV
jgi:hypothetical protein